MTADEYSFLWLGRFRQTDCEEMPVASLVYLDGIRRWRIMRFKLNRLESSD